MTERIEDRVACPACGAAEGEACHTVVNGVETHWTHDLRIYAAAGWRGAS